MRLNGTTHLLKNLNKNCVQQPEFRWARRANNETPVERNRFLAVHYGFSVNLFWSTLIEREVLFILGSANNGF